MPNKYLIGGAVMLAFINAENLNELFKWITIVAIILAAVAVSGKLIIMLRSSKTSKKDEGGYYPEQQPDYDDEKAKPEPFFSADSKTAGNDNAKPSKEPAQETGDIVFLDESPSYGGTFSKKKHVSDLDRALERNAKKDAKGSAKKATKEMIRKIKK